MYVLVYMLLSLKIILYDIVSSLKSVLSRVMIKFMK